MTQIPTSPQKLTANQQRFVDEYLIDFNGCRAYKVAYPSIKNNETARAAASRLLTYVNVLDAIQKGREKIAKRAELSQDETAKGFKDLAFYDTRKLFTPDGKLRNINELTEEEAFCITGLTAKTVLDKTGEGFQEAIITNIKLANRQPALEAIAKILGMFEKDNAQKSPDLPGIINIRLINPGEEIPADED